MRIAVVEMCVVNRVDIRFHTRTQRSVELDDGVWGLRHQYVATGVFKFPYNTVSPVGQTSQIQSPRELCRGGKSLTSDGVAIDVRRIEFYLQTRQRRAM